MVEQIIYYSFMVIGIILSIMVTIGFILRD